MRNVGGSSRSACTTPSTSTRGALSPPIASSAMRITSVLDRHPLLAAVVAAGGAHVVRPLQIAAARARLQRDVRRLVVGAAGALLPFGGPSLGYGHWGCPRFSRGACLWRRRGPATGDRRPAHSRRGPHSSPRRSAGTARGSPRGTLPTAAPPATALLARRGAGRP